MAIPRPPLTDSGKVGENPWAFYPLFPYLARGAMAVTGLDFPVVASTIALLCGFAAAVLMGLLLRDRIGDPAAYLVVALWASFPASVTLQLAYTESLAMLLLVAYLYALSREWWLVATMVAVLVELSRPIAVRSGSSPSSWSCCGGAGGPSGPIEAGRMPRCWRRSPVFGIAGLLWPANRVVVHGGVDGVHRHNGGLA